MEFWHLIGRGVEKRDIVLDDTDRVRFIHDLYVFNDNNPTPNFILKNRQLEKPRDLLVHLHAFCLMNNHYHLLVSEIAEGGIPLFMKKLNMGYAKYFNERYKRSGALWQGKYRKVQIARNAHFMYVPFYIHLNPLDYILPEWRRGEVRSVHKALQHLKRYRWSSHLDYLGEKNFPSVITQKELKGLLGDRKSYEQQIKQIIQNEELAAESDSLELFKN